MDTISKLRTLGDRLIARAPKGLFRFLSVGMVGLASHTIVFTVIFKLNAPRSAAWFAGLVVATLVTWQLNRRLTFVATGRPRRAEVTRYALVTGVAQTISYAGFLLTCTFAPKVPPSIAVIVGAVVATLFSYTGQRFFTFAPHNVAPTPSSPEGLSLESAPVQEVPIV
jgi:putative flippase GtrA